LPSSNSSETDSQIKIVTEAANIKQYDSTVKVGIVVPPAKNAASKNHHKNILRDKNHFYRIVLVHNTFKIRKSSDGWILDF